MSLHVALQTVGLPVVALAERLTDGGDGFVGVGRIDLHITRLARP